MYAYKEEKARMEKAKKSNSSESVESGQPDDFSIFKIDKVASNFKFLQDLNCPMCEPFPKSQTYFNLFVIFLFS